MGETGTRIIDHYIIEDKFCLKLTQIFNEMPRIEKKTSAKKQSIHIFKSVRKET